MPESDSLAEAERKKKKKTTTTEAERQTFRAAPRSRSHGGARRVAPAILAVERRLSNGDLYAGGFVGDLPEGQGKYLWADGCMYEGEWRRGKACGRGKFSWPTGATYEGEFRRGRMEGIGTFTAADGGTYRGAWSQDAREGYGRKCYSNGDVYEGWWRRNLQDGDGKYLWRNGNQYSGEWSSGEISGKGSLIWPTGGRYEGRWDHGIPVGNGVLVSSEGCNHTGKWTKDAGDRLHRFTTTSERMTADVQFPLTGKLSSEERQLPRICIWEVDGGDCGGDRDGGGDIICDIVESVLPAAAVDAADLRRATPAKVSCEGGRQGDIIVVGHKSYDLMLSLQLGIRHTVGNQRGRGGSMNSGDFDGSASRWRRFPREGSRTTPPHQSPEFRWKDYCPTVFRRLREEFKVDPAEYMMAICGDDAFRGLSSPGKSGSSFYLTQDERFMIKTVKKSEVKVLLKMLRSYYNHVCEHNTSLLTKFFGVHCVKPVGGPKTRFVIMGNLLFSELRIHRLFDLKGSSHGRRTERAGGEIDGTTTLKDLDLNFAFRLRPDRFYELKRQIDIDCQFLEAEGIMDYSLLVGIHFMDAETGDPFGSLSGTEEVFQSRKLARDCPILEPGLPRSNRVPSFRKPTMCLGRSVPARAERRRQGRSGGEPSAARSGPTRTPPRRPEAHESVLHLGIIDILQDYDISKRLEHVYKSLQVDPASISAVDPKHYSRRIREFIGRIFVEDS